LIHNRNFPFQQIGGITMSVNTQLAARLGITRQRVGQLIQEGVIIDRPDGSFDVEANAARYEKYLAGDLNAAADEIEELAKAVDAGMARLRAARGVEQRRKLGRAIGPLLGRLDAALRLAIAMAPPHARPVLTTCANVSSGGLLGEFMELNNIRLADEG
jgi:hypothetical protein